MPCRKRLGCLLWSALVGSQSDLHGGPDSGGAARMGYAGGIGGLRALAERVDSLPSADPPIGVRCSVGLIERGCGPAVVGEAEAPKPIRADEVAGVAVKPGKMAKC